MLKQTKENDRIKLLANALSYASAAFENQPQSFISVLAGDLHANPYTAQKPALFVASPNASFHTCREYNKICSQSKKNNNKKKIIYIYI